MNSQRSRTSSLPFARARVFAKAFAVAMPSLLLTSTSAFAASSSVNGSALQASPRETVNEIRCTPLPEAVATLRNQGIPIAYSDGLLSQSMLVKQASLAKEPEESLRAMVAPYGLQVDKLSDGTLSVVPGPDLDQGAIRTLRRNAGPLLQRETSTAVIPDWTVLADQNASHPQTAIGSGLVQQVGFPGSIPPISEGTAFLLVDLSQTELPRANSPAQLAPELSFELKQFIVELSSRSPRARVGVAASESTLEALVSKDLAPYVDGYLAADALGYVPPHDPTGLVWQRGSLGSQNLLDTLLQASTSGASLVLLDRPPSADEQRYLQAVRSTGAGLLERQPAVSSLGRTWTTVFLNPSSSRYFVAVNTEDTSTAELLSMPLEPMADARVLYPPEAEIGFEANGATTYLQLPAQQSLWLIELEPAAEPVRFGRALVEGEVVVDPYEVVVRNQAFREREAEKLVSLEVTEWATIVPLWRGGRQSRWEHRIFQRRGALDEYLHLNLWRDGVRQPKDKLFKGVLSRPIERIEKEPLQIERRDSYRYKYLGQESVDGHPTWKIGFSPLQKGRLIEGIVWIDQNTGAHRRIKSHHKGLGAGIVAGEFTTNFEWIYDSGNCFWDWRERKGLESVDYLDSVGTYQLDYTREDFRFNRPDTERRLAEAHASDVLIHVAAPPEGHRWLLSDEERRSKRGDQSYSEVSRQPTIIEDRVDFSVDGNKNSSTEYGNSEHSNFDLPTRSSFRTVLAGIGAFAANSRVTVGVVGGTGDSETDYNFGFNFVDLDVFNTADTGRGAWYLRLGGFEDDGIVSLTKTQFAGSPWSFTSSLDLAFDPQEDSLFRRVDSGVGDEQAVENLSLEVTTVALRTSFARGFGSGWLGRIRYSLKDITIERKPGTAPDFVVPFDTPEHIVGVELEYGKSPFTLETQVESGVRENWRAWGLNQRQGARDTWFRAGVRGSWSKAISKSQMFTTTGGVFLSSDADRFSRYRLFEVDARVPGYSSSIGFDEGFHAAVAYNFRIWKLPFAVRVDTVRLGFSDDPLDPDQPDQTLTGAQLQLNLHGPFSTDLLFGAGRGLDASPSRGKEETYYWMFVSRRFGGR